MKIVDAGVIVNLLVGDVDPERLGNEELGCPHPLDSEVTHVLQALVRRGVLTEEQGDLAMEGFIDLGLTRFPAEGLRQRMWQLRHDLSGYDATYVALTERTGATSLLTTDARLARSPGHECAIEVVTGGDATSTQPPSRGRVPVAIRDRRWFGGGGASRSPEASILNRENSVAQNRTMTVD